MAVFEMGSHGWHLPVCRSILKNTMDGAIVASVGIHVFGSRPDQRHDDVPGFGMLEPHV